MKDTIFCSNFRLNLKGNLLETKGPIVMGILNITPDSFYAKSRVNNLNSLVENARKMINEGAKIIDIGGYSSRPGADDVTELEELKRVIPAIQKLTKEIPDIVISIDTFRSKVAQQSLEAGACIINDISGGQADEEIFKIAAKHKAPYIIMHMKGTPQTMQSFTTYKDLLIDINKFFAQQIKKALSAGVTDIIIDPGFGFSKTMDQNYELLDNLEMMQLLKLPVLVGVSRKSMIYKKLGISAEDSLEGTIALNTIAIKKGAAILRVHDVKEAIEVIEKQRVIP